MLQNISIEKLYPHPDNPRKDLGDLSELVESIRAQGILQNLTVVPRQPGYCVSCQLWNGSAGKCQEGYDKTEHPPCTKWESDGTYTVIIGHRRLAAAKEAGLTEVPCTVTEMTPSDQVATMLLENMQRNDLNLYEQACGIQMMFDLGENVKTISDKTGLSKKTILKRVKVMKLGLDQEKFKESVMRGGTLIDYLELEKIEDPELRNKVLESIGTPNFRNELEKAITQEKYRKNAEEIIEKLKTFAKEIQENEIRSYEFVRSYYLGMKEKVEMPEDAENGKYAFTRSTYHIALYKFVPEDAEAKRRKEIEDREKERRERAAALSEASKRTYKLRSDFAKGISNSDLRKHTGVIIESLLQDLLDGYINIDYDDIADFVGIELPEDDADDPGNGVWKAIAEELRKQPEKFLWAAAYCALDSETVGYHQYWSCIYEGNEELDRVYRILELFGYQMSDEEKALRDGTHELYMKAE